MTQVITTPMSDALFGQERGAPQHQGFQLDQGDAYEVKWMKSRQLAGHCRASIASDQQSITIELTDFEVDEPTGIKWRPMFHTGFDGYTRLLCILADRI